MPNKSPYEAAVAQFLAVKALYSVANDAGASLLGAHHAPLRTDLKHPREIWDLFQAAGAPYRPEPFGGAADHYTNPQRVQWSLVNGKPDGALDCDDLALWAAATWQACGGSASLFTILDLGFVGNHTLARINLPDGRIAVIDTNGYREFADWSPEAILGTWTQIYASLGYRYFAVVEHGGPWIK